MSSGMTGALSAATIKFDNATKLISGVTAIDKLDQYGITVDNIHQILDTNRKAFSGFTQSATTLFKKLQEDVESGFTFAVSSVSGIIRTNIESGLSETFLKKTALTSAITEANAQLFDQSKEFTNGVFANASAFTLSKFNEVSSNLGSLSGDVRGLASGFTELNNQFVFYTPTSAMSGVVLNITNDKFVKQNDFGASVSGIVESVVGDKFAEASALTLTKFDEVANSINNFQSAFGIYSAATESALTEYFKEVNGQLNDFDTTVKNNTGKVSTLQSIVDNLNDELKLYTPTEEMDSDFISERIDISVIQEMGKFATKSDISDEVNKCLSSNTKLELAIENYIKNSTGFTAVVNNVVGKNFVSKFVSKSEFISFSGAVSNRIDKICGVADGGDIVYP